MCMMFHTRGTALSVAFLQEQGRYIYVTPTSYLELLATYKELLELKRKEVDRVRNRYSVNYQLFYLIGQSTCRNSDSCYILIKRVNTTKLSYL